MIRQAITCDICASEKRQTNHWFVAHEQGGELRLTGWNSRNRLRPGSKHLCGQTCLHKLVDEFMARVVAVRVQSLEDSAPLLAIPELETSLTSTSAYEPRAPVERAPAAHIPDPTETLQPKLLASRPPTEIVEIAGRQVSEAPIVSDESPRYSSRNWRAEAWDRERERELRAVERRTDPGTRRRSGA